tara:strand:- start:673 stop:1503 length:831 start_codon:yes stop_codon:yes gene_type:complete
MEKKLSIRKIIREIILSENAEFRPSSTGDLLSNYAIVDTVGLNDETGDIEWDIVLIDLSLAKQTFDEEIDGLDPEESEYPGRHQVGEALEQSLVSAIRCRKLPKSYGTCYRAWEIIRIGSLQRGFGWPLKNMVMGNPLGTIPDRDSLSQGAVDQYTRLNSRGGFELLPLDDVNNPQTKTSDDDCKVWPSPPESSSSKLNNVYKFPEDPNFETLKRNIYKLYDYIMDHNRIPEFEYWVEDDEFTSTIGSQTTIRDLVGVVFESVYDPTSNKQVIYKN